MHPFRQVDVFSAEPLRGNPVAVVHADQGDDVPTDQQMATFARWTNLSETTFLLPPTAAGADYRVRIFTPSSELPFAGHPTLGTAHAWLEAGGVPTGADPDVLVQQCEAGLVDVRRGETLAFSAPALLRSGPPDHGTLESAAAALRLDVDDVIAAEWVDNGPGWLALLLRSAADVLAVRPDWARTDDLKLGVVGPHETGSPCAVEVRAMFGSSEDPVTGSLNAGIAQWLIGNGTLPPSYVASQGTVLGRAGRVHVEQVAETIWVGGTTRTTITGSVDLG